MILLHLFTRVLLLKSFPVICFHLVTRLLHHKSCFVSCGNLKTTLGRQTTDPDFRPSCAATEFRTPNFYPVFDHLPSLNTMYNVIEPRIVVGLIRTYFIFWCMSRLAKYDFIAEWCKLLKVPLRQRGMEFQDSGISVGISEEAASKRHYRYTSPSNKFTTGEMHKIGNFEIWKRDLLII